VKKKILSLLSFGLKLHIKKKTKKRKQKTDSKKSKMARMVGSFLLKYSTGY